MSCTDSTNTVYQTFWYNYFVSTGYIDSTTNLNAPYGICSNSLLWINHLINWVHFFVLSSGILYLINFHLNKSGFWWPFFTWILSLIFMIASIILFILRNSVKNIFYILIIGFQVAALAILWISLFVVVAFTFTIERRYHRCLLFFIIILFLMQIGCLVFQILVTLHCAFNLKFISASLDYAYLSSIIAASGIIISTLLLDHIFMWNREGLRSTKVRTVPIIPSNSTQNQSAAPAGSMLLEDSRYQPETSPRFIYSSQDGTRNFYAERRKRQTDDNKTVTKHIRHASCQVDEDNF